jgi:spermine synthase
MNHSKIIVGDCIDFMEKCAKEGRKFDYIFADLTDIPISQTPQVIIID